MAKLQEKQAARKVEQEREKAENERERRKRVSLQGSSNGDVGEVIAE